MLNMLMTLLFECTNKLTLSEGSVFESTLCTRSLDPCYTGGFQRSALSQDLSTMQIPAGSI